MSSFEYREMYMVTSVITEPVEIKSFIGTHLTGKSNDDVIDYITEKRKT